MIKSGFISNLQTGIRILFLKLKEKHCNIECFSFFNCRNR